MSRQAFGIERALRIFDENSDTAYVDYLSGAGAPLGTSGKTDDAPIGSMYSDRSTGAVYKKITNTSSAADWEEIGNVSIDDLHWRNELVRAATVDTVTAGTVDPTGFSDNESGLDGNDFSVGEYLIGDIDGVPALFEVTAVNAANDITVAAAAQAIASNDTFVVQAYLPDSPAAQELQAIIHIPVAGSPGIKIGDINWNFADGINLAAGYTAGSGDVSASDTVQSAIQKVDGNNDAQDSVLGTAQGATNLGAFTGFGAILLTATESVKSAIQKISDFLGGLRVVQVTGITSATAVDSVAHASVKHVVWHFEAFEEATPANRKSGTIEALTDGTSVDDTEYAKLKIGANFDLTLAVAINGANMELQASSGTAGVTVTVRRVQVA